MPNTKTRIVGSGFTTLEYAGKRIAFLDSFQDSGQRPINAPGSGASYAPVHPLDSPHAVEIATSSVLGTGTITANIRELWNAPVWYQLQGLSGRRNITDVWQAIRNSPMAVTCRMVIRPPGLPPRGKLYHNCIVVAIPDDENVTLGTLTISRAIEIVYTHTTAI